MASQATEGKLILMDSAEDSKGGNQAPLPLPARSALWAAHSGTASPAPTPRVAHVCGVRVLQSWLRSTLRVCCWTHLTCLHSHLQEAVSSVSGTHTLPCEEPNHSTFL